jgi:hypothetical protein
MPSSAIEYKHIQQRFQEPVLYSLKPHSVVDATEDCAVNVENFPSVPTARR